MPLSRHTGQIMSMQHLEIAGSSRTIQQDLSNGTSPAWYRIAPMESKLEFLRCQTLLAKIPVHLTPHAMLYFVLQRGSLRSCSIMRC